MLRLRWLLTWALCLALTSGVLQAAAPVRTLRLITYASERPTEELKKMEPVQRALEAALNAEGKPPIKVSLRIFPTYEEALQAVIANEADLARLGPVNYVMAKAGNPRIKVLVMESHEGRNYFDGVIVVAKGAAIHSVADLKGKRMAFGEAHSTTGRYLAQAALVKAGISAPSLSGYDYLGRHDKVVYAVAAGSFDAGAANENTFRKYADGKGLRALLRYRSPTHAWVAHPDLEPALVERVRAALLVMRGVDLAGIDRSGFQTGSDADYDALRRAMHEAKAFGG